MAATKHKDKQTNSPRIGSKVTFRLGEVRIEGVIVEDRGNIGAGGRRLYRIEAALEPDYHAVVELPTDEFELKI